MYKYLLSQVFACLLFLSCSNKDTTPPPATLKQYFRGKLNGTAFNDTTTGIILITPNNGLQIIGYHANGGINLWLRPYNGMTGNNIVNQDNIIFIGNTGGQFYAGFINGKVQGSGNITILEITNHFIRGTFDCIAPADSNYSILPTQIVSEGEFKLKKP